MIVMNRQLLELEATGQILFYCGVLVLIYLLGFDYCPSFAQLIMSLSSFMDHLAIFILLKIMPLTQTSLSNLLIGQYLRKLISYLALWVVTEVLSPPLPFYFSLEEMNNQAQVRQNFIWTSQVS